MFISLLLLYLVEINHIDASAAGTAVSIGFLASFALIPIASILVDKLGAKTALAVCAVLSAISYAALAASFHIYSVIIVAFAISGTDRIYATAWPTIAAQRYGKEQITEVFGTVSALRTFFLAAGALSSAVLLSVLHDGGLEAALWINVTSYGLGVLLLLADKISYSSSAPKIPSPPWACLKNPQFLKLLMSQILVSISWVIPSAILPIFLTAVLSLPLYYVPAILIIRYVTIVSLQMPLLLVSKTYSESTSLRAGIACSTLAVVVLSALPLVQSAAQITGTALAVVLLGASECLSKPVASSMAIRMAPSGGEAGYMATFQLATTLAAAVAPLLAGSLLISANLVWAAIGIALAVSTIISFASMNSVRQRKVQ